MAISSPNPNEQSTTTVHNTDLLAHTARLLVPDSRCEREGEAGDYMVKDAPGHSLSTSGLDHLEIGYAIQA